ncbi:hypothetical protein [Flavobacterium sp. I3-2]|uniref:hypothetical protein n=1 Tax=Flavobacterium sp. I3-2 TaxID=2748319 RepID=UPI0015AC4B0C|nr:hypothetical protein [Flavobacterium sp. I3-2]
MKLKKEIKIALCSFIMIFLIGSKTNAQLVFRSISVVGTNWTPIIPTITEAGSDYVGTYTTPTDQIKLNVAVPLLSSSKISVRYEANSIWDNSIKIQLNKLNNGIGLCVGCSITPSGETPFQEILQTDTELFKIVALGSLLSVNNINLNLRLSGISVTVPVDNYSAKIVFTIGPL